MTRQKDQRRVPLSMRLTPELRRKLVADAAEKGRSTTQEAEYRLERSFELDFLADRLDRQEALLHQIEASLDAMRPLLLRAARS